MEDQRHSRASSRNSEILQNRLMTDIKELFAATRYYKKEQGITKTCQTCKHWGELDTVRIEEGKCEKIYQNIHIPNEVQWRKREWLLTSATFGCNGYEQKLNGNL